MGEVERKLEERPVSVVGYNTLGKIEGKYMKRRLDGTKKTEVRVQRETLPDGVSPEIPLDLFDTSDVVAYTWNGKGFNNANVNNCIALASMLPVSELIPDEVIPIAKSMLGAYEILILDSEDKTKIGLLAMVKNEKE